MRSTLSPSCMLLAFLTRPPLLRRLRKSATFSTSITSSLSPPAIKRILASPTSAYIHLPFCVQRCYYCNFSVHISTDVDLHLRYLDSLFQEISITAERMHNVEPLRTVYLGGGTPSLLAPHLVDRLLDHLRSTFGIDENAEVTIEMDPKTFDLAKAESFRASGINRVSVGAQSTHDSALVACGRLHRREDVFKALEHLERAGFTNASVDLISGLPTDAVSMSQFLTSVREVTASDIVSHISVYDLSIEPGTLFGKRYSEGVAPLPDEGDAAQSLMSASKLLSTELGYKRYEISNYAKDGLLSQHNMNYWRGAPFYAFGVGATSFVNGTRFRRPNTIPKYEQFVREGVRLDAIGEPREWLEDLIINGMRLLDEGLRLNALDRQCADILLQTVHNAGFVRDKLTEVVGDGEEQAIRLTADGAMLENTVVSTLLQGAVWDPVAIPRRQATSRTQGRRRDARK